MSDVSAAEARERRRRGHFAEDLSGRAFGLLTVTQRSPVSGHRGEARWVCRCACGALTVVMGKHLRSGAIVSCGCRGSAPRPSAPSRSSRAPAPEPEPEPEAQPAIPPPPPSTSRTSPRMLPMYAETVAHRCDRTPQHDERTRANAVARAWGVERRHACDRYDACLDRVPHAAIDARCPRDCPGYEVAESETREARMLAAVARTAFDTASQLPNTSGLAMRKDGR